MCKMYAGSVTVEASMLLPVIIGILISIISLTLDQHSVNLSQSQHFLENEKLRDYPEDWMEKYVEETLKGE